MKMTDSLTVKSSKYLSIQLVQSAAYSAREARERERNSGLDEWNHLQVPAFAGTTCVRAELSLCSYVFFSESSTRLTSRRCSAISESGSSLPFSSQGLPRPISLAMIL